jgi:hypothetical protein
MRATPAACTGRSRRKSDPAGPARSTPPDIGDVGVFFDSAARAERACSHDPPLPTTDRFRNQGGRDVLIGYVALDQAVTAATPGSRPEVFPTLQAEVSDPRLFADPTVQQRLTVAAPSVGTVCADGPGAICVPLG